MGSQRIRCPKCGANRYWRLSDGRYKCRKCRHRFRSQSAWELSRLAPRTKLKLTEYFALGVPAWRVRFRTEATTKAVERFYRILRACCLLDEERYWEKPVGGVVELDETLFGGRRKGKRGWGAAGKIIAFGIYKRNGRVKVFAVPDRKKETLLELVERVTKPGSLYYTDDYHAYATLRQRGDHVVVNKEKGVPKGRTHINGIEGFWSYAKNWLYPYRGIPRKNFHLYMGEICWRFNHREEDLFPLLLKLLRETPADEVREILVRDG